MGEYESAKRITAASLPYSAEVSSAAVLAALTYNDYDAYVVLD